MYNNYTYEPEKLLASKPQITPDAYKQTYMLTVDTIEYAVTALIQKKKIFIAFRADFRLPENSVTTHNHEEHVFKMFSSMNAIFNRYLKTPSNIKVLGDFKVESIEVSPALNIANYAIALGKRNKLYEDMMDCYIFNNKVDYSIDYNGNNLIFKDLKMRPKCEETMKFSEI